MLRMLGTLIRTAAAATYLLGNAVAFTRVDDRGRAIQRLQSLDTSFTGGGMWHRALVTHSYAAQIEACNSYGLFRRMTGVEARPEVILEGSRDGKVWEEYNFKYKPGDVWRQPPVVAPHQPRVDWQMWFAALGQIEHNAWLVQTCLNLMEGNKEVRPIL